MATAMEGIQYSFERSERGKRYFDRVNPFDKREVTQALQKFALINLGNTPRNRFDPPPSPPEKAQECQDRSLPNTQGLHSTSAKQRPGENTGQHGDGDARKLEDQHHQRNSFWNDNPLVHRPARKRLRSATHDWSYQERPRQDRPYRDQPYQDPDEPSHWNPAANSYYIMADGQTRGDYYRGTAGGNTGGYSRKRRFREDDDYDRPRYRPREYKEPLSHRVRRQITTIAENPLRDAKVDTIDLAKLITDNHEDEYFCKQLSDFLPQLVVEQPMKIPFVAAIVLNVNHQRSSMIDQILDKFTLRTQATVEAGEWRSFKLLFRFFACTTPMFEDDGIFNILEELFNRAADLQTASSEDAVGLELVQIIMLTLPYLLTTPSRPGLQENAAGILEKTEIMASARHAFEDLIGPYIGGEGEDIPPTHNMIALLQKQLQNEAAKEWQLSFIPRLFDPPQAQDETDETDKFQRHPFPPIEIPQIVNPGPRTLFPQVFFSLYADQEVETVPPTSNLASSVIRDALVDTINIIDFNRAAAAKLLIEVSYYWAPGTFVERATPFDKLKDVSEGSSTWKSEDLAVDAIFSQMIHLPSPEHRVVYYHSMITETCKIAPSAIAPSLGRAIRFLYRSLDILDLELIYRFMDWFSHHLSNFDFRWKWIEWVDDVELPDLHPRKAFIMGTLDKEVRLSFAKRVRETLPEVYQILIPASRDNDIPEFKYSLDDTPYSEEGKAVLTLFKKKAPESEVQSQIESIREKEQTRLGEEISTNDPNLALIACVDAYVTALSHIGSKSLSHALSFIERHKDALLTFGSTSERLQVQIIDSVVAYWRNTQPGVAVNLVDKLLNYTIVSPSSVIQWALSDPVRLNAGRNLSDSWLFEMVSGTMGKITRRMQQIITARNKADLPIPHAGQLDETLQREAGDTRALFQMVEDALRGVAEGANDVMIEEGVASDDELAFLKMWGRKWTRVFKRKRVVEEVVLSEAVKGFPPPVEEAALMEGVATNGGDAETIETTMDGDVPPGAPAPVNGGMDADMGDGQADGEDGV